MNNKLKKFINIKNLITIIIAVLMYIACRYRLYLAGHQGLYFDLAKAETYDTGFFLYNVLAFDNFNINIPYALIKNRSYMWFLLLANWTKLDLRIFLSIIWIICSLLLYFTIYKITNNKILAFIFFVFVLLHPIAYFAITVYRSIIFVPTIIILLSLYTLFCHYYLKEQYIQSIIISILLGLMFIFIYFLTETGIVFLAIHLGLLSLFLLLAIIDCFKNYINNNTLSSKQEILSYIIKRVLIIIVPIIIGIFGIVSYKFINYRVFGVYAINMRTEGEVANFISNVQDIESDNTNTYIWCTQDQIDKAYAASYTFQQNLLLYNYLKNETLGTTENKDYHGDFLGWGITQALENNKISYKDASLIFKDINQELEDAFKKGILTKTKKVRLTKTLGRFSVNEIKNDIMPIFKMTLKTMTFYKDMGYWVKGIFTQKPIDSSGKFIEFFHIEDNEVVDSLQDQFNNLVNNYCIINYIIVCFLIFNLFVSSVILLVNIIFSFIAKLKTINNYINIKIRSYIMSLVFCSFYILYLLSISFFNVWLHHYNTDTEFVGTIYHYCSMSIGFMIFAVIFSFLSYQTCLLSNINRLKSYILKHYNGYKE